MEDAYWDESHDDALELTSTRTLFHLCRKLISCFLRGDEWSDEGNLPDGTHLTVQSNGSVQVTTGTSSNVPTTISVEEKRAYYSLKENLIQFEDEVPYEAVVTLLKSTAINNVSTK